MKILGLCAVAAFALVASQAGAQVYANAGDQSIYAFGANATPTYGQTFTAPGGELTSWTFFDGDSTDHGAQLEIATWDGSTAGSPLYSSLTQSVAASGDWYSHTFSGINLSLTAGTSYIAFLTVTGVSDPVSYIGFAGSSSSPLGGEFRYNYSYGDPAGNGSGWYDYVVPAMQYRATFGSGAVPEPASWALMLGGFGLVGSAMRSSRRKAAVSFG